MVKTRVFDIIIEASWFLFQRSALIYKNELSGNLLYLSDNSAIMSIWYGKISNFETLVWVLKNRRMLYSTAIIHQYSVNINQEYLF